MSKRLTVALCDFNICTAIVPTPPEAPNIRTLVHLGDLNHKFPDKYKADQAVIAAYRMEHDSAADKCLGL